MQPSQFSRPIGMPTAALVLLVSLTCGQKPDPAAMNKQAVVDCFTAMDRQDYAKCRELWPAGDAAHPPIHVAGSPDMTREQLIAFLQDYWKAFPDTRHTLHLVLAEGDVVVARVSCEGTQKGPFEGQPPSGKRVLYSGVHIVRFAHGKIQDWWCLDDNLGLMQQLGLQLTPAVPAVHEKGK